MSHLVKSNQLLHARLQYDLNLWENSMLPHPVKGKRQKKTSASDKCHPTSKERKANKREKVKTLMPEVSLAMALHSLSEPHEECPCPL